MSDAYYQRILSLCVKKTSSVLFNILIILCCFSCSSHPNRAPVSSVGQPQSLKVNTHVVARGDTLYAIAWRYNLDYKNLAKINGIGPPYSILPGQKIHLKGVAARQPYRAKAVPKKNKKAVSSSVPVKVNSRVVKNTQSPVVVKSQSVVLTAVISSTQTLIRKYPCPESSASQYFSPFLVHPSSFQILTVMEISYGTSPIIALIS